MSMTDKKVSGTDSSQSYDSHFDEDTNTSNSSVISTSDSDGKRVEHLKTPSTPVLVPESTSQLDGENGPAGPEGNGFGNCVVSWFKDAGTAVREMLSSVAASISSKFSAFFGSLTGMFSALRNAFSFSETANENEETAAEQPAVKTQET